MKKSLIALFMLGIVLLISTTTAFAAGYDAQGFYRADYIIASGKIGYSPSTIYGARNGFSTSVATYVLEGYETISWGRMADGTPSPIGPLGVGDSVNVHIYNRQEGVQCTGRKTVSQGNSVDLAYTGYRGSSYTYKPVTYKTNTDHEYADVQLTAKFRP